MLESLYSLLWTVHFELFQLHFLFYSLGTTLWFIHYLLVLIIEHVLVLEVNLSIKESGMWESIREWIIALRKHNFLIRLIILKFFVFTQDAYSWVPWLFHYLLKVTEWLMTFYNYFHWLQFFRFLDNRISFIFHQLPFLLLHYFLRDQINRA